MQQTCTQPFAVFIIEGKIIIEKLFACKSVSKSTKLSVHSINRLFFIIYFIIKLLLVVVLFCTLKSDFWGQNFYYFFMYFSVNIIMLKFLLNEIKTFLRTQTKLFQKSSTFPKKVQICKNFCISIYTGRLPAGDILKQCCGPQRNHIYNDISNP